MSDRQSNNPSSAAELNPPIQSSSLPGIGDLLSQALNLFSQYRNPLIVLAIAIALVSVPINYTRDLPYTISTSDSATPGQSISYPALLDATPLHTPIHQLVQNGHLSGNWQSFIPWIVGAAVVAIVLAVLSWFLGLVQMAVLAYRVTDPSQGVITARKKIWPYLLTSLLYTLLIIAGLMLFIVPGIYWGVKYSFYGWTVLNEDVSGSAALRRSGDYVKGHWWATFGRLFVAGLVVGAVISIITTVIYGMLTGPFFDNQLTTAAVAAAVVATALAGAVEAVGQAFSHAFSLTLFQHLKDLKAATATDS